MLSARSCLVQFVLLSMGCQSFGGVMASLHISGSCSGSFGGTENGRALVSLAASVNQFGDAATQLDVALRTACVHMGDAMHLALRDRDDTRAACEQVALQVREDMTQLRAQHGLQVEIAVSPPRCSVNVDAYAQCAGGCDASFQPGRAEVRCEGGEISGTCSGECRGACWASVSGSCSGTCQGVCDGTCSARSSDGSCAGTCSGTCRGQCAVRAQGQCGGECHGGCSVAYTAPHCSGHIVPPRISARCSASCDARLNAQASCTPAGAMLRVTGDAGADLLPRVERLRAAVEGGYGDLLAVAVRVRRVAETGADLVSNAQSLPGIIGGLGASAAICAGAASAGAVAAMAKVSTSVSVSVNVSASFSASGG